MDRLLVRARDPGGLITIYQRVTEAGGAENGDLRKRELRPLSRSTKHPIGRRFGRQ